MEVELKNGEKIILEVTPLILEYIEDYEGGLEQTKTMYATNQILYAIIASNYDEPLTYRQAVRLVKLEDVEKIVEFVIENTPRIEEKKQRKSHRI